MSQNAAVGPSIGSKSHQTEGGTFFVFLNSYRWLNWVLAVVLLVAKVTPPTPVAVTITVYSLVFIYNFIFTWRSRDIERLLRRWPALISIDIIFCFAIVLVYGWRSPFTAYGFSPVMMVGFILGIKGGFFVAAVCAAGYALSVITRGPAWDRIVSMGMLDQELFQCFDYFLVAIFFSYPASLAEKLRRTNAELVAAQAKVERLILTKERERLAGDFHDSVTQSLLAVGMILTDASRARLEDKQLSKRLALAREANAKALEEIRLSIDDLFEDHYAAQPLAELAGSAVNDLRQSHNIQATFVAPESDGDIDPETKKAFCLILQESLSNAAKHAHAGRVDVSLVVGPTSINLKVVDDGEGFSVDGVDRGYGLKMMAQRAEGLRGKCHIFSEPGKGTTVIATVPAGGKNP